MTARRAYGSGSIREVRPGVHVLRWRTGTDPLTGKPIQHQETYRGTGKAAHRRLAEHVAARPAVGSGVTLGHLLAAFTAAGTVKPSTMASYRYALAHLPETLLATRADSLAAPTLAALYRRLDGAGVGRQTIYKLRTALSSAYRHGIEWGWLEANPVRGARTPTITQRLKITPTAEHIRAMIAEADATPGALGVWVRLAAGTGARRSELLGLLWHEVDLDAGVLDLTRTGTKTTAARRSITLDELTAAALRRWHAQAAERALSVGVALAADAYVISDELDSTKPWRGDLATKRLPRLAVRAGCAGARLHDLRHAHATMLLEAGISPRTVADRLGHSRPSTTLNMYGHALPGADAAAADVYGALMRRG